MMEQEMNLLNEIQLKDKEITELRKKITQLRE